MVRLHAVGPDGKPIDSYDAISLLIVIGRDRYGNGNRFSSCGGVRVSDASGDNAASSGHADQPAITRN
jgi:hypothetical protein